LFPLANLTRRRLQEYVDAREGRSSHDRPAITMKERFRILMEEVDRPNGSDGKDKNTKGYIIVVRSQAFR
jgi:hypothetical protein